MNHKYTFILSKHSDMIFISHLDLIRLLGRAVRRAQLKVELSQGFNPHLKIKMKRALKLGVASNSEEGELSLSEFMESFELARRLQKELPCGIDIMDLKSS